MVSVFGLLECGMVSIFVTDEMIHTASGGNAGIGTIMTPVGNWFWSTLQSLPVLALVAWYVCVANPRLGVIPVLLWLIPWFIPEYRVTVSALLYGFAILTVLFAVFGKGKSPTESERI